VRAYCGMLFGLLFGTIAGATVQAAEAYPARPIRIIILVQPGGGSDITSRGVAQKMTEAWGQQVVIEQRPGAGGTIAAETVARAQPDGYTLLLATGSYTINASLQKQSYDLLRDFIPVSLAATVPFVLVVHPAVAARSVYDLIALARTQPGRLSYSISRTCRTRAADRRCSICSADAST